MFKAVQHTGFITRKIDALYDFYSKLPGVKVMTEIYTLEDYAIKDYQDIKMQKLGYFGYK